MKPLADRELDIQSESQIKNFYLRQNLSNFRPDLLLQQNNLTLVTGIEVNRTDDRLEVILKIVAGSEQLVPLILPEGNNLVIDILDATLAFAIKNGVTKTDPAAGIGEVDLIKIDDSSIRLTITGEKNAPSVLTTKNSLGLAIFYITHRE
jgi:iron complex outermembrane recepter protein